MTKHDEEDDESWWDEATQERMPGTVSKLKSCGGVVYLIGTAHLSQASMEDVTKVMRAVQPQIVCIELCSSRLRFITDDNPRTIELAGGATGKMRVTQGGEFRQAVLEAKQLPNGCEVQLIDRPVGITLKRALRSLSLAQMVRLAWQLSASSNTMTVEKMEALKKRGAAEQALKPLAEGFPKLHHVMVGERDICMAFLLHKAVRRDKIVLTGAAKRVVGVVGIGHVPGITKHFGLVTEADVLPLLTLPTPRSRRALLFGGVSIAIIGAIATKRLLSGTRPT